MRAHPHSFHVSASSLRLPVPSSAELPWTPQHNLPDSSLSPSLWTQLYNVLTGQSLLLGGPAIYAHMYTKANTLMNKTGLPVNNTSAASLVLSSLKLGTALYTRLCRPCKAMQALHGELQINLSKPFTFHLHSKVQQMCCLNLILVSLISTTFTLYSLQSGLMCFPPQPMNRPRQSEERRRGNSSCFSFTSSVCCRGGCSKW